VKTTERKAATKKPGANAQRSRLTRRELLATGVAGAAGLALGAAPIQRAAAQTPQNHGNILTVALQFYAETFDPAIGVAGPHYRIFVNTYEGLVEYQRGTANLRPALAASWTVSQDLTVFTFKLRPNVKFHDGSTLDAEAVKLSFDRVKKLGQGPVIFLRQTKEIEVVDPLTVRITLTQPSSTFVLGLSKVFVHGKAHATDPDDGRAWFALNINGTGPFGLGQTEKNQWILLRRHAPYWKGWPDKHVDGVLIRIIPDSGTQKLMLARGEVDMMNLYSIGPDEPPENLAKLPGVKLVKSPTYRTFFYPMNVQKANSPLRDKRVRKAFALAFDYDALRDVYYGYEQVPNGFLPPGFVGYDRSRPKFKQDLPAARKLLADAGYPQGFETPLDVNQEEEQGRKLGLLFQASLKQVGVNASILYSPPPGVFYAQIAKLETAPVSGPHLTQSPLSADAGTYIRQIFGGAYAGQPYNFAWYQNPEVDRRLDAADKEPDPNKRIALWRQAESLIIDDQPVVFAAFATPIVEPVRERVMNYLYHPFDYSGVFQFYYVWLS